MALPVPGIVHASHLGDLELSPEEFARMRSDGVIASPRRDWFATAAVPQHVLRAISAGVRLTCISAAVFYGLWIPPLIGGIHVYAVRNEYTGMARFVEHRLPYLRTWPDYMPIAPLILVLEHAARCLSVINAAILIESALNLRLIGLDEVLAMIETLPRQVRRQLQRVKTSAQSGTETKVRWWLESQGVAVRAQVPISGVGRVDLLIGENLVIECDSATYHTDRAQYHRDRERDLVLIALGYQVIRLTWEQVFLDWDSTRAVLTAKIRTRSHTQRRRAH